MSNERDLLYYKRKTHNGYMWEYENQPKQEKKSYKKNDTTDNIFKERYEKVVKKYVELKKTEVLLRKQIQQLQLESKELKAKLQISFNLE